MLARTFVGALLSFCVWTVIGPRQSFTAPDRAAVVKASFVGPVDARRSAIVCATYRTVPGSPATLSPLAPTAACATSDAASLLLPEPTLYRTCIPAGAAIEPLPFAAYNATMIVLAEVVVTEGAVKLELLARFESVAGFVANASMGFCGSMSAYATMPPTAITFGEKFQV